jgi:hypothetical protein
VEQTPLATPCASARRWPLRLADNGDWRSRQGDDVTRYSELFWDERLKLDLFEREAAAELARYSQTPTRPKK